MQKVLITNPLTEQELPVRVVEAAFLLKQSSPKYSEYLPKSYNDQGVIKGIHIFCFPFGSVPSSTYQGPQNWLYHGFVLTNQAGGRVYCHCLRFSDVVEDDVLALCVVSKQCYYNTMKHFLVHLLSGAFTNNHTKEDYDWREVLNFLVHCCVCPRNYRVALKLSFTGSFEFSHHFSSIPTVRCKPSSKNHDHEHARQYQHLSFLFGLPPSNPFSIPQVDFDFSLLFTTLSMNNIITVLECVLGIICALYVAYILGEAKIVFSTSRVSILSHITEAFVTILWPFSWQHVLVPVLPDAIHDILDAPTPYIIGIVRKDPTPPPLDEDVVFVDLDRDNVIKPTKAGQARLPPEVVNDLKERLYQYSKTHLFKYDHALEKKIRILENDSLTYSCHESTAYARNIQFEFMMMWRKLFVGWDFSQISIAEIASYSNTKSFRVFFNTFCLTQSFDQYCLKVKECIASSSSTPESSHASVSSSPVAADTNINLSVPSYLNNRKKSEANDSGDFSVDIRSTTNTPARINCTPNHLSASPEQIKAEKAIRFKEYKNYRHYYELIHRFLTDETSETPPYEILMQLFYRPTTVCEIAYTPIEVVPVDTTEVIQPNLSLEAVKFNVFSPRRQKSSNKLAKEPLFKDGGAKVSGKTRGWGLPRGGALAINTVSLDRINITIEQKLKALKSTTAMPPLVNSPQPSSATALTALRSTPSKRLKEQASSSSPAILVPTDSQNFSSAVPTPTISIPDANAENGAPTIPKLDLSKSVDMGSVDSAPVTPNSDLAEDLNKISKIFPLNKCNGTFSQNHNVVLTLNCWREDVIRKNITHVIEFLSEEIDNISHTHDTDSTHSTHDDESSSTTTTTNPLAVSTSIPMHIPPQPQPQQLTEIFTLDKGDPDQIFSELISKAPQHPTTNYHITSLLYLIIYYNINTQSYYNLLVALGKLYKYYPQNELITRVMLFDIFTKMKIESNDSVGLWKDMLCYEVIDYYLQLYLEEKYLDGFRKLQKQLSNEIKTSKEKNKIEVFAESLVTRRDKEEKKRNQLYSLDFSFILALEPPGGTTISMKAFFQWTATSGGIRDVTTAIKLYHILTKDDALEVRKLVLLVSQLKERYKYFTKLNARAGKLPSAFQSVTDFFARSVNYTSNTSSTLNTSKGENAAPTKSEVNLHPPVVITTTANTDNIDTSAPTSTRIEEPQPISVPVENTSSVTTTSSEGVSGIIDIEISSPTSTTESSTSAIPTTSTPPSKSPRTSGQVPTLSIVKPNGEVKVSPRKLPVHAPQAHPEALVVSNIPKHLYMNNTSTPTSNMTPTTLTPSTTPPRQTSTPQPTLTVTSPSTTKSLPTPISPTPNANLPAIVTTSPEKPMSPQPLSNPIHARVAMTGSEALSPSKSNSGKYRSKQDYSDDDSSTTSTGPTKDGLCRDGLIVLHATNVRYGKDTGQLFLATQEVIFKSSDYSKPIYSIPFSIIRLVEPYNYTFLLLPGVSGMKIETTLDPGKDRENPENVDIFYIPSGRSFWCACVREMLSGYQVSQFLGDKSYLIDSAINILYSGTLKQNNFEKHLILLEDLIAKGNQYIAPLRNMTFRKKDEGVLNLESPSQREDRLNRKEPPALDHPCNIVFQLLSNAIQLFFSYAISANTVTPRKTKLQYYAPKKHSKGSKGKDEEGFVGIDFDKLRKSKGYEAFVAATSELQFIDNTVLTQDELTAFLVNVYNLVNGSSSHDFAAILLAELHSTSKLLRGKNVVETFTGDLGPFELNKERLQFTLPILDPRIHFVLCQHNVSSLPIRVLTPHTIDAHLEACAAEYFEKEIIIETNRSVNRVTLSMLFYWYQEDFFDVTKQKNRKGGENEMADMSLGWLTPEQNKKIADLVNLQNNYEIRYKYDWTPNPKLPL